MDDSQDSRYDYVTVGHVTRDVIEDRAGGTVSQPGGSAFYGALQAARLGLHTLIVTQGVPREIGELLEPLSGELDLRIIPAEHTTTLSTRGSGAQRSQRLLTWAGPIVEPLTLDTEILHLAPVARETPLAWRGQADFIGLTPQGLARHWGQSEDVTLAQLDPNALPRRFNAAVISERERPNCHALFTAARRHGACVAVTAGPRPATVHLAPGQGGGSTTGGDGQVEQTSIPPVTDVRDDIGAGDVFAAAFFIALNEGRSPLEAATFGNAAAAARIAGVGPGAIAGRAQIEAAASADRPKPA